VPDGSVFVGIPRVLHVAFIDPTQLILNFQVVEHVFLKYTLFGHLNIHIACLEEILQCCIIRQSLLFHMHQDLINRKW